MGIKHIQYLAGLISEQAFRESVEERGPFGPGVDGLVADIKSYLKSEGIGGDVTLFGKGAWAARNERVGENCELALIAEGELNHLLNGHRQGGTDVYHAIEGIAKRHGFFMEQGYSYSWHFYKR